MPRVVTSAEQHFLINEPSVDSIRVSRTVAIHEDHVKPCAKRKLYCHFGSHWKGCLVEGEVCR